MNLLDQLIEARDLLLKEMPQEGTPTREALDKLDGIIDDLEGGYYNLKRNA